MVDFLSALAERVLVLDGAMGTELHARGLTADDFWGKEGCNEMLVRSRPDVVKAVHAAYFEAGSDAVQTNTFGGSALVLKGYGLGEETLELNREAAMLGREVAGSFSTPDRPRFVMGSIGPGGKLPTLGQVDFDELADSYEVQVRGLVQGGVDGVVIETCQDLLQAKAAVIAARRAFGIEGRAVPIAVSVTLGTGGRMLMGSDIAVALATLDALRVDLVGLNCATGPAEMGEHLRYLASHARMPILVQPNAGLPEIRDGKPHYALSPEALADAHERFVTELGVSVVGGCCGTSAAHMREVARRVSGRAPVARLVQHEPSAASLYAAVPLSRDVSVLVVGERTNANGSKAFRELLLEDDYDSVGVMARAQAREGAHLLDVCVDFVGRDGRTDMSEVVKRLVGTSSLPLVLDSTDPETMLAGLKLIGGRPVLNSVNLEDGEQGRAARVLSLAREFGAAVVALAIDEQGQARTVERKLEVCRRIYRLATERFGLEAPDLFFDVLTYPLGSGQEELRGDAVATLEALGQFKAEFPDCLTILGVSNVSFGLKPAAREVLNSVFLHEAAVRGLDAAIMRASGVLPLHRISEDRRAAALELIHDRRRPGHDPLVVFMALFEEAGDEPAAAEELAGLPVEERLRRRVVDADRAGLEDDLREALEGRGALEIVDDVLLEGMREVGELFASGDTQLPFVLASAEVMNAAVAFLKPHMGKSETANKGKIVLATVRGDVHDIGKNLVDIILSNNGYTVYNLGTKQPIGVIAEKAREVEADAIGLSGLLVKSVAVMREDLEELNARGLSHFPVLLGGAALTRAYVEDELRSVYRGKVFYGRDAFEGLSIMDSLKAAGDPEDPQPTGRRPAQAKSRPQPPLAGSEGEAPGEVEKTGIPIPPFAGSRLVSSIPIREVAAFLDEASLFRARWGYRRGRRSPEEYEAFLEAEVRPVLSGWLDRCEVDQLLAPQAVYGFFAAGSEGDDLVVFGQEAGERARFTFPRQRGRRRLCIADYVRGVASGERDWVAFQLVSVGRGATAEATNLFESDAYRDYMHFHGLSVAMAEATAELMHARIRREWGIGGDDAPNLASLLGGGYRGARYSFGYPACPNLEDQAKIFDLLDPGRIGVSLSEEFQLVPEQSTSALVVHHPAAGHFRVG